MAGLAEVEVTHSKSLPPHHSHWDAEEAEVERRVDEEALDAEMKPRHVHSLHFRCLYLRWSVCDDLGDQHLPSNPYGAAQLCLLLVIIGR
jgi:hypothetical protein